VTKPGKLFIVSGPSGAGKSTLVSAVLESIGAIYKVERAVTYTTKQPRPGEVPGKDYIYVSVNDFEMHLAQGLFLEITQGLGHYYGTPRSIIDNVIKGISQVLIIDREGAKQMLTHVPEAVLIWIEVKSIEILHMRLVNRLTETLEQVEKRIGRAEKEILQEINEKLYHYHIINDDFKVAQSNIEHVFVKHLQNMSHSDTVKLIKPAI
jgi:guanylate kinase